MLLVTPNYKKVYRPEGWQREAFLVGPARQLSNNNNEHRHNKLNTAELGYNVIEGTE